VNIELERMYREIATTQFEVLSWHLPEITGYAIKNSIQDSRNKIILSSATFVKIEPQ
jgi:hypothetical protein